jgi:hypothetical protein
MIKININDLTNVGDLIFFDGPLMSLFTNKEKGHFYIFDWVNSNQQFNQWIAYEVPLSRISKFMEGTLSHLDLMRHALHNEFILMDIDDNLNYYQRSTLTFEALPPSYLPKENTYFLIKNCPDFAAIQRQMPSNTHKTRLKELELIV